LKPGSLLRVALALLVLAVMAANIVLAVQGIRAGSRGMADWAGFYLAGRMVADGRSAYLYELAAQVDYQQRLFGMVRSTVPFNHPPFEALVFAPLSLLPFAQSLYLWALINVLLLFATAHWLRPLLSAEIPWREAAVWCPALAFAPIAVALMQGQDSVLQLFFFALAFIALKRNRDALGGGVLALALIKWHLVVPVALILLLRREVKAITGFAAAAAALMLVSIAAAGVDGAMQYPMLLKYTAELLDLPNAMPNVRGFIAAFSVGETFLRVATIAISVVVFLLAAVAPRPAEKRGLWFDLDFGLAITVAALVGYHVYLHDLTILFLPLILLTSALVEHKRWLGLLVPSLFLFLPAYLIAFGGAYLGMLAIPVTALAAALWVERRRAASVPV